MTISQLLQMLQTLRRFVDGGKGRFESKFMDEAAATIESFVNTHVKHPIFPLALIDKIKLPATI
jgi:hypothetical protein